MKGGHLLAKGFCRCGAKVIARGNMTANGEYDLICELTNVGKHQSCTLSRRHCRGNNRKELQEKLKTRTVVNVHQELLSLGDKPSIPSDKRVNQYP